MLEHAYKDLYNQDSVNKQMVISYDGGEITNAELYAESFELAESLCSESELRFGSCEASVVKFKIANAVDSLKDKWLTVTETLNGDTKTPFRFGEYKVYSDTPSGDRNYRNVTAYDAMYDIINAEVVEWYNSLEFPMTQKEFRDSFFEYLGIVQEETELIHDSMEVERTFSTESIGGKSIITAICELNGVFGHINRQGNFEYISLTNTVYEIGTNLHQSSEYEDFETSLITKVQVRQEEGDIGGVYGDGTNCYVVQDNFLAFGKDSEELADICERLYQKICNITYRPFKAVIKGNPCREVGDLVLVHARKKDIQGYVLQRTLKGVQSLKDTFQTNGVQEYSENPNSTSVEIRKLKSKTNILERTVEETVMKVTNVETTTYKLALKLSSNLPLTQTYNKSSEMYSPDYTTNNLIIIPMATYKDKEVECVYEWKKVVHGNETDLEDGEIVGENGELIVNINIADDYAIYRCFANCVSENLTAQNTVQLIKNTVKNGTNGADGKDGEDATTLRIDSSRGTVFKNNAVSTILSAVIYKGSKRITDIDTLHEVFGSSAYLQWSWQRMDENTFGTILSTDSRIGDDGFTFALSPDDVDTKVTFMCQLITD